MAEISFKILALLHYPNFPVSITLFPLLNCNQKSHRFSETFLFTLPELFCHHFSPHHFSPFPLLPHPFKSPPTSTFCRRQLICTVRVKSPLPLNFFFPAHFISPSNHHQCHPHHPNHYHSSHLHSSLVFCCSSSHRLIPISSNLFNFSLFYYYFFSILPISHSKLEVLFCFTFLSFVLFIFYVNYFQIYVFQNSKFQNYFSVYVQNCLPNCLQLFLKNILFTCLLFVLNVLNNN